MDEKIPLVTLAANFNSELLMKYKIEKTAMLLSKINKLERDYTERRATLEKEVANVEEEKYIQMEEEEKWFLSTSAVKKYIN